MSKVIPLTEARANLSELINQAFYEGTPFGVAKGNKPMGVFVGIRQWREIIDTLEMHNQGLADTIAIMADHELQKSLLESEENAKKGNVISWEQVLSEVDNDE